MNKYIKTSQAGFTMIEMLVALVILSVGLLGIAALQTRGQQFNHAAYVHTQATFLAYDLADRMRNNLPVAEAGNYEASGSPGSDTKCEYPAGSNCSTTALRDYDLTEWFKLVEESLPGGRAEVLRRPGESAYTITIMWDGEQLDEDDSPEQKQQVWRVEI